VNYDLDDGPSLSPEFPQTISEVDPTDPTLRTAGPWTFQPYIFPKFGGGPGSGSEDGALHVVELVVSNGFDLDGPLPNRSPAPGFEIQLYRWVFVNRPAPVGCPPGSAGCCPPP
jgi:hypothetical protein